MTPTSTSTSTRSPTTNEDVRSDKLLHSVVNASRYVHGVPMALSAYVASFIMLTVLELQFIHIDIATDLDQHKYTHKQQDVRSDKLLHSVVSGSRYVPWCFHTFHGV
eukprot:869373-Amphidinium_carterae.1